MGAERGIAVALQWICFGLSFVSFAFYAFKVRIHSRETRCTGVIPPRRAPVLRLSIPRKTVPNHAQLAQLVFPTAHCRGSGHGAKTLAMGHPTSVNGNSW